MAVIFKPIQEKLTAKLEQKQIQTVLRAESLADAGAREVENWRRHLLTQLMTNAMPDAEFVEVTLEIMERKIKEIFRSGLINTTMWSYKEATSIFIKAIPRRWFRIANPVTVLAGEAVGGIDIETPTEPVVGTRMGDAEWEEFVRQNVFLPPSADEVEQIINQPINGEGWSSRIDKLSLLVKDKNLLAKDLVQGYSSGKTLQQLAKIVEGHTAGAKASAMRIARTEGLRVANKVQRKSYDQLGDLMAGEQIVATLDQNTRPHHATRNGTIFWSDMRRSPNISSLPELPDEPNCRCFSIPVLKPPKELENDPRMAAEFANAAGQPIPAPADYLEWWRSAPEAKRKMVIGVKRYETVRRIVGREPNWQDFIDGTGQVMKIDDLKKESPKQREKRSAVASDAIKQRGQLLQQVATYGFVTKMPVPKRPEPIIPPTPPIAPPITPLRPVPPRPQDSEPVEIIPASPPRPGVPLPPVAPVVPVAIIQPVSLPPKLEFTPEQRKAIEKQLEFSPLRTRDIANVDEMIRRINDDSKVKNYQLWSQTHAGTTKELREKFLATRPGGNKENRAKLEEGHKELVITAGQLEKLDTKFKRLSNAIMKGATKEERLRRAAEANTVVEEYNKIAAGHFAKEKEVRSLRNSLFADRNMPPDHPLVLKDHYKFNIEPDGTSPVSKERVNGSLEAIQGMISNQNNATAGDIKFGKAKDGRAYYDDSRRRIMISDKEPKEVIVHEVGHMIDQNSGDSVKSLIDGFMAKRIRESSNNQIEIMRTAKKTREGIEPTEMGIPDEFKKGFAPDPVRLKKDRRDIYAGKFYQHGPTEILSMGLEAFYTDPYGFAEKDPEYFDLVVGVLHRRGIP